MNVYSTSPGKASFSKASGPSQTDDYVNLVLGQKVEEKKPESGNSKSDYVNIVVGEKNRDKTLSSKQTTNRNESKSSEASSSNKLTILIAICFAVAFGVVIGLFAKINADFNQALQIQNNHAQILQDQQIKQNKQMEQIKFQNITLQNQMIQLQTQRENLQKQMQQQQQTNQSLEETNNQIQQQMQAFQNFRLTVESDNQTFSNSISYLNNQQASYEENTKQELALIDMNFTLIKMELLDNFSLELDEYIIEVSNNINLTTSNLSRELNKQIMLVDQKQEMVFNETLAILYRGYFETDDGWVSPFDGYQYKLFVNETANLTDACEFCHGIGAGLFHMQLYGGEFLRWLFEKKITSHFWIGTLYAGNNRENYCTEKLQDSGSSFQMQNFNVSDDQCAYLDSDVNGSWGLFKSNCSDSNSIICQRKML